MLYCLVTEAHWCEQLARGCYAALPRVRPVDLKSNAHTRCANAYAIIRPDVNVGADPVGILPGALASEN